nr:ribosomal protein S11 [Actinocyclus sp. mgcode 4]
MLFLHSFNLKKSKKTLKSITIKKNNKINFFKKLKIKQFNLNKKLTIEKNLTNLNNNKYVNFVFFNRSNFKINKQINYIFIINSNYSNIFINIINNYNEQVCSFSLGFAKFKSLDKITKKYTLLQVIKNLIKNYSIKQKNIALHLNSNNSLYTKLIINFLKNYCYVQIIKFYNYLPHNGCRPKKKRRK